MRDFDYDVMQKKSIARGATRMKNGSKSKKCSLPHDGCTPAQLRRLNGPVSTYKMDEPMTWESFKAMPVDLQKRYIVGLQEMYQANDSMLAEMFGVGIQVVARMRKKIGVGPFNFGGRLSAKDIEIRDAKWAAFCNGVVGGGNSESVIPSLYNDDAPFGVDKVDEPVEPIVDEPSESRQIRDMLELDSLKLDIYRPETLDVTFISEDLHAESINKMIRQMVLPEGKCKIRISIEKL